MNHSQTSAPPGSRPPPTDVGHSFNLVLRGPWPTLVDDVELQRLWLALHRRPWRSLAVVSATKGTATLDVANTLANMASWYTGQPTCVLDMRDLSLRLVECQLHEMASQLARAQRVFLALRPAFENPTAQLAARSADAAVLCVELGKTRIREAEKSVESVGRERFLGTILVSGTTNASPPFSTPPANIGTGTAAK